MNADPAAPPEFYRPPPPVDYGHPEDDPPLTVRIRDWDDRLRLDALRVVRVGDETAFPHPWMPVTGRAYSDGLSHDEVRRWRITHPLHWQTAARLAAPARDTGPAQVLVGDMGPEAFRGETT